MRKIISITIGMLIFNYTYGQDENILIGLNTNALGVKIMANWPAYTGAWARGYHISNHDASQDLFGLGVLGEVNNGVSGISYGWIGKNYSNVYMAFVPNGNVGIGTTTPSERLSVNGKIRAKEVKVEATNWPDYVFDEKYQLKKLEGVEQFIKENKHLPEIPSAAEVEKEGISLGEMNAKLLKKIEELTLYVIELNRVVQGQQIQLNQSKKK